MTEIIDCTETLKMKVNSNVLVMVLKLSIKIGNCGDCLGELIERLTLEISI